MAILNDFPVLTGDNVIGVGTNPFLMCPADQMCALIEWVSQDMTDPCTAPRIIVDVTFRIALYPRDRNLVIHELLCDPHTAPAVQRHVIDFSDHRRRLRVKDQMPPVIRVTHQSERRLPTTKLSLPGTGHTPRQHLLEISRLYISFRIFLKGVMSISWRVRLSTPSVMAIYRTLCLGKKISI